MIKLFWHLAQINACSAFLKQKTLTLILCKMIGKKKFFLYFCSLYKHLISATCASSLKIMTYVNKKGCSQCVSVT